MKKFYIFTLCALAVAGSADAAGRFTRKSHAAKSKVTVTEKRESLRAPKGADGAIMRPATLSEYIFIENEWQKMADVALEYDNRGNTVKETVDEEGFISIIESTYNDNDMVVLRTESGGEEGAIEPTAKRTYVYDNIVTDYYIERMGYEWVDGNWAADYYCETNDITRNSDNNITDIVKSLPLEGQMTPAYKSEWIYDGADKPVEYNYYTYNLYADEGPAWELYDATSFKEIKWENFDGQPVKEIEELVTGANRVSQFTVYYEGEPDGFCFFEYSDKNPDDYIIKQTTNNPDETGVVIKRETIDDNGSYKISSSEYFYLDANDNPIITEEPVFTEEMTVTIDDHGNIILIESTITEGDITELVEGERYDYTYDAAGNPTEVILSFYDYDLDDYVPDMKTVYGEYNDVAAAIDAIATDKAGAEPEYYNLYGVKLSHPEAGSIVIVRRGAEVTKEIIR